MNEDKIISQVKTYINYLLKNYKEIKYNVIYMAV